MVAVTQNISLCFNKEFPFLILENKQLDKETKAKHKLIELMLLFQGELKLLQPEQHVSLNRECLLVVPWQSQDTLLFGEYSRLYNLVFSPDFRR